MAANSTPPVSVAAVGRAVGTGAVDDPTASSASAAAAAGRMLPAAIRGDDLVNAENLGLLFRGRIPSSHDVEAVFAQYDVDRDDALDERELTSLIHDLYAVSIETSRHTAAYRARARAALETERGRELVAGAVRELIAIRDTNRNGKLEHNEFVRQIESAHRNSSEYWRLAPLADVKISVDVLADPYQKWKIFVAGGCAGAISKSIGAPLSRLTVLLQTQGMLSAAAAAAAGAGATGAGAGAATQRVGFWAMAARVHATEGLRGFFRGNLVDITRAVPYSGLNYLAYEFWKPLCLEHDPSASGAYGRLVAGGLSGVTALLTTYPLDLVRTRVMVDRRAGAERTSVLQLLRGVVARDGVRGLYRGCGLAVVEKFPALALNFGVYDVARDAFSRRSPRIAADTLLLGLLSGSVAATASTLVCFPFDLVLKRLQLDGSQAAAAAANSATATAAAGGAKPQRMYTGAVHCFRSVVAREGVRGLYTGLLPQLAKSVPICASSLAVYDVAKKALGLELER